VRFYVGHTALLPLRQCPYNTIQYNELMLIIAPSYSTLDSALPSTPNIGGGTSPPVSMPMLIVLLCHNGTASSAYYVDEDVKALFTHSLTHSLTLRDVLQVAGKYSLLEEQSSISILLCPAHNTRQTDRRQTKASLHASALSGAEA